MVRFVAHFLSSAHENEEEDYGLRFLSLVEFDVRETDEAEPVDDGDEDVAHAAGGATA